MGEGPVTGASDRPSRSPLENRTAAEFRQERQSARARGRKAFVALHNAEMDLLVASQRAARHAALRAIDAALSSRHASAIAIVVARFADRRAALAAMSDTERNAALRQLAVDEAHELARLALELASEKRAMRKASLLSMAVMHRAARRNLGLRNRRQRISVSVQQGRVWRPEPFSLRRRAHPKIADKLSSKSFGSN